MFGMSAQSSLTLDKVSGSSSGSSSMLGVKEGTKFHSLQEHGTCCALPAKEDLDRNLMMNGKPAHFAASADVVQSQSEVPTTDAVPKDAAAARQTATASTSEPQNGESIGDPEPSNGVPVFVMLPLDTVILSTRVNPCHPLHCTAFIHLYLNFTTFGRFSSS